MQQIKPLQGKLTRFGPFNNLYHSGFILIKVKSSRQEPYHRDFQRLSHSLKIFLSLLFYNCKLYSQIIYSP